MLAALLFAAAALVPADTIPGLVLDDRGAPVGGAVVGRVTADGPTYDLAADADGRFAVPVRRVGDRMYVPELIARGPDGVLGLRPSSPADGTARVTLAPPVVIDVTVTGPDGTPAAGVTLYAMASLRPIGAATTAADGTATLAVPTGAEIEAVVALAPGVGFAFIQNRSIVNSRITTGPIPRRVDLTLTPADPFAVRCVEAAADGTEGDPVAGARARVWTIDPSVLEPLDLNLSGLAAARGVAGPDGRVRFDWLPADAEQTTITVSAGGYGEVRVKADGPDRPAEAVAALVRDGVIAGRVTLADGAPAAGVDVRARSQAVAYNGAQSSHLAVTGPDGRYEMTVPGAAAYLIVPLPGHLGSWRERDPDSKLAAAVVGLNEPFVLAAGERRADMDFTLTPGAAVIGVVARGGRPVADEHVYLTATAPVAPIAEKNAGEFAEPMAPEMARSTRTDAAGFYTFRVGPGTYRVSVGGYGGRDGTDVTVEPGDDRVAANFPFPE